VKARRAWERTRSAAGRAARGLAGLGVAVVLTALVFLVLPLIQQVARPPADDLELRPASSVNLPPPAPPPPEPEQKPPDDEPPPPSLDAPDTPPMDLSDLELALNPSFGDGLGGEIAARMLSSVENRVREEADAIFSLSDLDQAPRVVHQVTPEYPAELKRKRVAGSVHVLFVVDPSGAVQNPIVQQSSHPAFEPPALQAVRKWRFEPGRRNGQPVPFRMKVPIVFAMK